MSVTNNIHEVGFCQDKALVQQYKAKLADDLIHEGDGFFRSLGKEGLLGLRRIGMTHGTV